MGNQKFREPESRSQLTLLPRSIEDFVAVDDRVRLVDEIIAELDLSGIESKYSEQGRPGYSPRILTKILAYGTMRGIRSSRELARATRENLRFIFLSQGERPDFRTISDFRKRFQSELGAILSQTVRIGLQEGLIKLEQVAIDGTKIKGFAGRNSFKSAAKLEQELQALDRSISVALAAGIAADNEQQADEDCDDDDIDRLPPSLRGKQERRERIQQALKQIAGSSNGAARRLQASSTDPDCRFMKGTPGYNAQAAIDVESGLVVGAYVTTNNNDTRELKRGVDSVLTNTGGVLPESVVADAGYATYSEIAAVEELDIELYVPALNKAKGSRELFTFDSKSNAYICKNGKRLESRGIANSKQLYGTNECAGCTLRAQCAPRSNPNGTKRIIGTHIHASVAEGMRLKMLGAEAKEAMRRRRCTIEPLFGIVKYCRKLHQLLLRGLAAVDPAWRFEMAVHNIAKLTLIRAT